MLSTDDTIAAIASSHTDPGQRGIVRISGPAAVALVAQFFEADNSDRRRQRTRATRIPGRVDLGDPLGAVPCDLYLWPTIRSYTQQPTAELHTYGAAPILNAVLGLVCENGARLAEPGEFTLRSFLGGRIDLAQAEAVLGVIDAANDRELNVALTQLAGGLSQPLTAMRDTLLNLVADLEAGLDFVDEDIEFVSQEHLLQQLAATEQSMAQLELQMKSRVTSESLPRVVLRGEPNVGKSSLWNAMVQRDNVEAIVDEVAGTTRDYLVGDVDTPHGRFQLIDTAGVEQTVGDLGRSMMQAGERQIEDANLVLLCIDVSRPPTEWEQQQLDNLDEARTLVVLTKSDLAAASPTSSGFDAKVHHADTAAIRALADLCCERMQSLGAEASVVANTASRCRDSLRLAKESVLRAKALVETQAGDELVASEIRIGLDHLGQIVGAVYTDDILDRIFSRFCIGK